MKLKERAKDFVVGALVTAMVGGSVIAFANPVSRDITVQQGHINLVVNGVPTTPRYAAGNEVQPFVYRGTTFLPVRACCRCT